jgi:hypothetical protein
MLTNVQRRTMNVGCHSSFGCHVAVGDGAPGFCMKGVSGGELRLLTSYSRCLLWVLRRSCSFRGRHCCLGGFLRLWVVVHPASSFRHGLSPRGGLGKLGGDAYEYLKNDERQISVRRSSFCCHVTVGDVAPLSCMRDVSGGAMRRT